MIHLCVRAYRALEYCTGEQWKRQRGRWPLKELKERAGSQFAWELLFVGSLEADSVCVVVNFGVSTFVRDYHLLLFIGFREKVGLHATPPDIL